MFITQGTRSIPGRETKIPQAAWCSKKCKMSSRAPLQTKCHLSSKYLLGSLVAQWIKIHLPMQGKDLIPSSGKILNAREQLSLRSTATEAALWRI